MKKTMSFLLFIFCAAACAQNGTISQQKDGLQKSLYEGLSKELASDHSINREMPFVLRKFNPYQNDSWIGNAICYGCYRKGQAPGLKGPSEAEILEDLTIIARHWNLIRIYGSDNDAERILRVIQTHALAVKVMLGIWLENDEKDSAKGKANVAQVMRAVELTYRYADIIAAVSVGNETQVFWSSHRMDPQSLIRYIRAVRNTTTLPVTSADDYNFWNTPDSKQVADELDFVVTHIHALWNGKTLDSAIGWMDETYRQVCAVHPLKIVVVGETGWATAYNPAKRGTGEQGTLIKGEVSLRAQEQFLIRINEWANTNRITTFLFEAFDESWKGGGESSEPNEIEKHWGLFYENRTPKVSFQNYLKQIQSK